MERLIASPISHIVALTACICSLVGVLVEIAYEVREFAIRLFFEMPWVAQSFEIAGWYTVCAGLLWVFFLMTFSPDDADEPFGHLVIVAIEYGPGD